MTSIESLVDLKTKGNNFFKQGSFDKAINAYTKALNLPRQSGEVETYRDLQSNRSAAHSSLKHWDLALEDAMAVTTLAPDWPKGYIRKAVAYQGLYQFNHCVAAYRKAYSLSKEPSVLQRIQEAEVARCG